MSSIYQDGRWWQHMRHSKSIGPSIDLPLYTPPLFTTNERDSPARSYSRYWRPAIQDGRRIHVSAAFLNSRWPPHSRQRGLSQFKMAAAFTSAWPFSIQDGRLAGFLISLAGHSAAVSNFSSRGLLFGHDTRLSLVSSQWNTWNDKDNGRHCQTAKDDDSCSGMIAATAPVWDGSCCGWQQSSVGR